jgi:hypothetical protein
MSRFTHIHLPVVAAALATAVAIAACGGSSSPPSTTPHTTASSAPPKNFGQAADQYSACMRNNGVSNFPDPKVHQNGNKVSVMIHMTPAIANSPAFQSAQKACAHFMPGGSANQPTAATVQRQRQYALAFAQCMRSHGFPNFPDPTAQGQLNPEMVTAAGINLHQPALLHAGLACVPVTHGLLTPADIERAVNGGRNGGGG